jgi:hypothetical protein
LSKLGFAKIEFGQQKTPGSTRLCGTIALQGAQNRPGRAQSQQEEMFGEERLLEIIRREAPSGSHALEEKFLKSIEEFTQGMPQTDDITFVVIEECQ